MTLPPYLARFLPQEQAVDAGVSVPGGPAPPGRHRVRLAGGGALELPLRVLPGGHRAIALLMSNQTSFEVEDALVDRLVPLARAQGPQTIVGIPTMGLDYARRVARALGHPQYAALGLSRKFWYDEVLGETVSSSTSPGQAKRLSLDPALLDRVAGRRVLLVDDVITTGASAGAALRLLLRAGAQVQGILVVLTEGQAWRGALESVGTGWASRVQALGHLPLFEPDGGGGWRPDAATGALDDA